MDQYEIKRKVFLPLDGSDHSHRAFEWYITNFWREGDCAIIFHAKSMPTIPVAPYPYGSIYVEEFNDLIQKENERARHLLEGYGERLKKHKIHFKLVTETAMQVGEVIVKNISEEKCSCVIMGRRDMSAMSRIVLGSTSTYVVHEVDIPIVVVPPPLHPKSPAQCVHGELSNAENEINLNTYDRPAS